MKRLFQFLLLLLVITYGVGDIITTTNALKLGLEEGNGVVKWIIANLDLNAFIVIKILATIIGCLSLVYCYEKGFRVTAIMIGVMITIISIMVIMNNIFAASGGGVPRIEHFLILPLQATMVLLPLTLLIAEAVYKEKNKLS